MTKRKQVWMEVKVEDDCMWRLTGKVYEEDRHSMKCKRVWVDTSNTCHRHI